MNSHEELELKKEFQLERIILFSDAVFAIIITIMVIDLKLPENIRHANPDELHKAFGNIVLKFAGYGISFFLVARFWMAHLKIFSFLKDYNSKLLVMNLLFLFCVSLFPFAVTLMTGATKPGSLEYGWGLDIYIAVFFTTTLAQLALTRYMIKNKESLCYSPDAIESVLKWKMVRIMFVMIPIFMIVLTICNIIGLQPYYFIGVLFGFGLLTRIVLKKFYPQALPENDDSRPFILRMFARRQKKSRVAKLPPGE